MIAAKTQHPEIPLRYAAAKITLPPGNIAEIRLRTGKCAAAVMTDCRMLRCSDIFTHEDINECFLEPAGIPCTATHGRYPRAT